MSIDRCHYIQILWDCNRSSEWYSEVPYKNFIFQKRSETTYEITKINISRTLKIIVLQKSEEQLPNKTKQFSVNSMSIIELEYVILFLLLDFLSSFWNKDFVLKL